MEKLASSVESSLKRDDLIKNPGLLSAPAERVQMRRVSSVDYNLYILLICGEVGEKRFVYAHAEWFGFTSDAIQFP